MFTVKFISHFNDGTSSERSISCPHYAIDRREDGSSEVTVYHGHNETGGVAYEVMSDEVAMKRKPGIYYNSCYIENDNGKTINRIV